MKNLGEEVRLKENLCFSLKRYSIWWFALLITMIFDYFSTLYFIQKYGDIGKPKISKSLLHKECPIPPQSAALVAIEGSDSL